jgi:hypothetical protein
MRVLLVGTLPAVIDDAEAVLRAAGHDVVQCRDAHAGTFPCTALDRRGSCPFEAGTVDVVVTARDRAWERPSPLEDGAVCGVHRLVPLIVHGETAREPFARWAVAETTTADELRDAVTSAVRAPLREHTAVARRTLEELLTTLAVDPDGCAVAVRRVGGRLVVEFALGPSAEDHAASITVKLLTALRQLDPYADGIDVARVESAR